jgi:hypothetical protein
MAPNSPGPTLYPPIGPIEVDTRAIWPVIAKGFNTKPKVNHALKLED